MKAELHIQGMHCDACAGLIKDTLEDTAGVHSADVNFGGASSTWIDAASNLGTIGTGWSNRASSVKFS